MIMIQTVVLIVILVLSIAASSTNDFLDSCCQHLHNPSLLLHCINSSSTISTRSTINTDEDEDLVTNRDVIFVTFLSPEIYSYGSKFFLLNSHYFHQNGYDFRVLSTDTGDDHYPEDRRWNKIAIVSKALRTWAKSRKYLIVIDADLLFINPKYDIVRVINQFGFYSISGIQTLSTDSNSAVRGVKNPNRTSHIVDQWRKSSAEYNLILSRDAIDIANTGSIIVRNSNWSIDFFKHWYSMRSKNSCDQHILNRLIRNLNRSSGDSERTGNEFSLNINVVDEKVLNSRWPALQNYRDSDRILHLMGETNTAREVVANFTANAFCVAVEQWLHDQNILDAGDVILSSERRLSLPHHYNLSVDVILKLRRDSLLYRFNQLLETCHKAIAKEVTNFSINDRNIFEQLHHSVNEICSSKNIDLFEKSFCSEMIEEVFSMNRLAYQKLQDYCSGSQLFSDSGPDCPKNCAVRQDTATQLSKVKLFHLDQMAMLMYDNLVYAEEKEVYGLKVIAFLDEIMSYMDTKVIGNKIYLHHKRGLVFSAIASFISESSSTNKRIKWERSLEYSKISIGEYVKILEVLSPSDIDFPGFVRQYVSVVNQIARSFLLLSECSTYEAYDKETIPHVHKPNEAEFETVAERQTDLLKSAEEWSSISINNAELLYYNFAAEERSIGLQLSNFYELHVQILRCINQDTDISNYVRARQDLLLKFDSTATK